MFNNKSKLLLVLVILFVTPFAIFSTSGATQKVVTYALPYDFTEYSLHTQQSYATAQWTSAVYAGLYARSVEADRDFSPDLAASASPTVSTDGKTVTVDLKADLKFASGGSLTAADVVFSYKTFVTPSISTAGYSFFAQYFDNSSVTAVDADTVQFVLNKTYAFTTSLISGGIVEKAAFEAQYNQCVNGQVAQCNWNADDGSFARSAGPFKVSSIDNTNDVVTLVKNDNYHTPAKVDRIVYTKYSEFAGASAQAATGAIDIIDSQYTQQVATINAIKDFESKVVGDPAHQEIALNHIHPAFGTGEGTPNGAVAGATAADKAAAALNVRKAFAHIVNREYASTVILNGLALPAASAMPSASVGWDDSILAYTFNISRAREYMAAAGYDYSTLETVGSDDYNTRKTSFFNITVLAPNTNPARNEWSNLWQYELSRIGVGVKSYENVGWDIIAPRTFSYKNTELTTTNYDVPLYDDSGYDVLFVGYGWALDWDPTGQYEYDSRRPLGGNFYNYNNETLTELVANYSKETDVTKRTAVAVDIQNHFKDQLPVVPILYPQSNWGFYTGLSGLDALLLSTSSAEWHLLDTDKSTEVGATSPTSTTSSTTSSSATTTTTSSSATSPTSSSATTTPSPLSAFAIFISFVVLVSFVTIVVRKRKK